MKFEVVCETVAEEKAKMFRWFVGIFLEQTYIAGEFREAEIVHLHCLYLCKRLLLAAKQYCIHTWCF